MRPTQTKVVILNEPTAAEVTGDTFKVVIQDIPELKDGEMLIKVTELDNVPAIRTWIDSRFEPKRLYVPPIKKGEAVRSFGIGEIIESKSDKYKVGDRVSCWPDLGWREYSILTDQAVTTVCPDIPGHSPNVALTIFGLNGLTAHHALFNEMKLTKDSTVLISSAAGSLGALAIQIAKNVIGCKKVVGTAGGKEKCEYVRSLGADDCLDYKDPSFEQNLSAAFPEEIDCYLDNVGGSVFDIVLKYIKRYGYVCYCGSISGYMGKPFNSVNFDQVLFNRITIKGMIVLDSISEFPKMIGDLVQWTMEGKIKPQKEVVIEAKSMEDIPKIWLKLFSGEIHGKLITTLP